jgi:GTP pyrophosphokinase
MLLLMPAPVGRHPSVQHGQRKVYGMIQIDDILESLRGENAAAELDKVQRAFAFAARFHKGKERLSGEPYISHPVEVARIVTCLHLDADTVATGLLHDTLEDTTATIEELRAEFGDDVAEMVDGVSKLSRITFRTSEQRQAESFRKMLLAMARDIRVILVKLADRLHNMRTLYHHPPDRQRKIAQETLDIYAPLANRLGISWLKSELEDLSFAALEPEAFKEIEQQVASHAAEREV